MRWRCLMGALLLGACTEMNPLSVGGDLAGRDLTGTGPADLTGTGPADLTGIRPPDLTGTRPPDLSQSEPPDLSHKQGHDLAVGQPQVQAALTGVAVTVTCAGIAADVVRVTGQLQLDNVGTADAGPISATDGSLLGPAGGVLGTFKIAPIDTGKIAPGGMDSVAVIKQPNSLVSQINWCDNRCNTSVTVQIAYSGPGAAAGATVQSAPVKITCLLTPGG